jgi:hypothetical protein
MLVFALPLDGVVVAWPFGTAFVAVAAGAWPFVVAWPFAAAVGTESSCASSPHLQSVFFPRPLVRGDLLGVCTLPAVVSDQEQSQRTLGFEARVEEHLGRALKLDGMEVAAFVSVVVDIAFVVVEALAVASYPRRPGCYSSASFVAVGSSSSAE